MKGEGERDVKAFDAYWVKEEVEVKLGNLVGERVVRDIVERDCRLGYK